MVPKLESLIWLTLETKKEQTQNSANQTSPKGAFGKQLFGVFQFSKKLEKSVPRK
jgi:hypothetical protein